MYSALPPSNIAPAGDVQYPGTCSVMAVGGLVLVSGGQKPGMLEIPCRGNTDPDKEVLVQNVNCTKVEKHCYG